MPDSSTEEKRETVTLGPLPASFLRLETSTRDGETVTTVTADPTVRVDAHPNVRVQRVNLPAQQQVPPLVVRPAQNPAYVPQAGFSITIAQAVLNKSYPLIGSMDPYVRLRVGHNTYETFTHTSADKNPCWNKVYHCPLPNTHSVRSIAVEVYDEKALTEDLKVAHAKIAVPDSVFQGHTLDDWFPLSGKLGNGKEGSINLIISYTTMPMVTVPHQRIHYPYVGAAPAHFTPPAPHQPPPLRDADVNSIKEMFPAVDKDVIKAVLESKRGNVESTVTAMLSMVGDNPSPPIPPPSETTQPPATQPPVTQPPVTQPPATQPPVDETDDPAIPL